MPSEGESDMGLFALRCATFTEDLPSYAATYVAGSGTGERNFLPFIPWLAASHEVGSIPCTDPRERIGVNTPEDLSRVSEWIRSRPPLA